MGVGVGVGVGVGRRRGPRRRNRNGSDNRRGRRGRSRHRRRRGPRGRRGRRSGRRGRGGRRSGRGRRRRGRRNRRGHRRRRAPHGYARSGRGSGLVGRLTPDPPETGGGGAEHEHGRDHQGPVAAGRAPRWRALHAGATRGRGGTLGRGLRPSSHGLLLGGRELGEVGEVLRAPLRRALETAHDRARELARQVGRDVRERGRQLAARAADEHLPGDGTCRVDVGLRRGRAPLDALRSRVAGLRRAALGPRQVAAEVVPDLDVRGLERGEDLPPVVHRVQGLAQPLDEAQPVGEGVILSEPRVELHVAEGRLAGAGHRVKRRPHFSSPAATGRLRPRVRTPAARGTFPPGAGRRAPRARRRESACRTQRPRGRS